jgi:hypothetical protein
MRIFQSTLRSPAYAARNGDVTSGRFDLESAVVSLERSGYICDHPAHRYFTSHKAIVGRCVPRAASRMSRPNVEAWPKACRAYLPIKHGLAVRLGSTQHVLQAGM